MPGHDTPCSDADDDVLVIVLAGGVGRAPVAADERTRQARRLFRRPVPHHRLRPQQLPQLGLPAHLHRHAVQVALAQPARPAGLEHRLGRARRVHRDPAAAEARRRALVSGHGRRGLSEPLLDRARERRAMSSCSPAITSTRWTTARCCGSTSRRARTVTLASIEVPIEDGRRFGIVAVDESERVIGLPGEAGRPAVDSGHARTWRSRRWASTSSTCDVLVHALEDDAARSDSHHDFGKNIIPALIGGGRVFSYQFYDENKKAAKYWRDIGTLDAYFEANMDLCQVNPEFNLYDPEWPLRTYQPQAPPAKFVFAEDGRARRSARLADLARLHRLGQPDLRQHPLSERARAQLLPHRAIDPDAGRARRPPRADPPRDRRPRRADPARRAHRLQRRRGSPPPHGHRGRHRRRHGRRRTVHRPDLRRRRCVLEAEADRRAD